MEKRENLYDREFKLKFMGEGEWLDEPDSITFEHEGIKCLVYRAIKTEPYCLTDPYFGGHLCGYIYLPPDHPLYNKECYDQFDCHHGITFQQVNEEGFMIGFDCAHSGDLIPSMEHMRNTVPELMEIKKLYPAPEGFEKHFLFNPTYRNVDFCIKECKSLAEQAAKMMVS
jgi:hypothetical protein